jgi:hypothetical protein
LPSLYRDEESLLARANRRHTGSTVSQRVQDSKKPEKIGKRKILGSVGSDSDPHFNSRGFTPIRETDANQVYLTVLFYQRM